MELPPVIDAMIVKAIDLVYYFEPHAKATVVLVPNIVNEKISGIAETTGQDVETLNYLLGLFACYPLGIIMGMLPYGKIKHFFSFILGAFLLQMTIGKQWVHHMITSLLAYFMFMFMPYKQTKFWVPFMTMVYITLGHLHRQYINYLGWDLDFTGSQMVLTMKLYAMAFNLYDGECIKKGTGDRATSKCEKYAISDLPGIIEYLGYTFCFSNLLAGPAYEFKIYEAACNGTLLYKPDGTPKGKIPSRIWPTLAPFLVSVICLGLFAVGNGTYFPILDPTDPQHNTPVVLTAEMLAKPFYYRYGYSWIGLLFVRCKYYFAWKNAEGANNIWYAGFEGFDEKKGVVKGWENSVNIDIFPFETASNIKTLSASWNKKTAHWLSHYVYMRTNGSLTATYGMSAFWHGFYPGYYLFFLSLPLVTTCERLGKKVLAPHFSSSNWSIFDIACKLSSSFVIQNIIMAFQLLSWEWSYTYLKSQYFCGHVACIIFYLVVSQIPKPKKKAA